MKRKLLPISLITVLSASLLAGCGKKNNVTLDDLFSNPLGTEQLSSIDMDVSVDIDASIDVSELFGSNTETIYLSSEKTDNYILSSMGDDVLDNKSFNKVNLPIAFEEEKANDTKMAAGLNLKYNVKAEPTILHGNGSVSYNVIGMSSNENYDTYICMNNDNTCTVYDYDNSNSIWHKVSIDAAALGIDLKAISNTSNLSAIFDTSLFEKLELKSNKKGYDVKGVLSMASVERKAMNVLASNTDALATVDDSLETIEQYIKDIKFDTEFIFDKDTKTLKEVTIELDKNSFNIPSVEINKFEINLVVNSINSESVTVPDDVKNNAEEAESPLLKSTIADTVEDEEYIPDEIDENLLYDVGDDNYPIENGEDTLAVLIFNKNVATREDIIEAISKTYMKQPNEAVLDAMVNMVNSNTLTKFTTNLENYQSWNTNNKMALVYFYGLGVFSNEDLASYGVDTNELADLYNDIYEHSK